MHKLHRFLLVSFLFLITLKNLLATDLSPISVSRPGSVEYVGQGFNISFIVANLNRLTAPAGRWSVKVEILNASNQVIWTTDTNPSNNVPGVNIQPYTSVAMQTSVQYVPTGTGVFKVRVTVIHADEINPANDIKEQSFSVIYGPPTPISNISPSNNATNVRPRSTEFSWTNGSVPFSQTRIFIQPNSSTVDFNANAVFTSTNTSFNYYIHTSDLPEGSQVAWGVEQTSSSGTTQNGSFVFTTSYLSPPPIVNVSPLDGAVDVLVSEPLSWDNGDGNISQTCVHVWPSQADVNWGSHAVYSVTGPAESYSPSQDWPFNTEVVWGVRQTNTFGTTNNGPFSFTTEQASSPPSQITNINPPADAVNIPFESTPFSWDNGPVPIDLTEVIISTSSSEFDWNAMPQVTNTAHDFDGFTYAAPLPAGTLVLWGVQQTNNNGSTRNGPFSFRTINDYPDEITDIIPVDGATDVLLNQPLGWTNGNEPINETDVHLWTSIENVSWNTGVVVSYTGPPPNSYLPTGGWPSSAQVWWGITQTNDRGSTHNGPFDFKTTSGSPPNPIVAIIPQDNAVDVPLDQPLSWTNGQNPIDETIVHISPSQSEFNWNSNAVYSATVANYNTYSPPDGWMANEYNWWGIQQRNQFGVTFNGPFNFLTVPLIDNNLDLSVFRIEDPYLPDAPIVGMINIGYTLLPNGFFLNVVASNSSTSNSIVIVDNLFYPGADQAAESPVISSFFDFTGLLNPNGQVPEKIDVKVFKSAEVKIHPFTNSDLISSQPLVVENYSQSAINVTDDPAPPTVVPVPSVPHVPADPHVVNIYRRNTRNLDLDNTQHGDTESFAGDFNACVPTSSANSLKWLETTYDDVKLPGDMTLRKTMENLSSKMKRERRGYTSWKNQIIGLLDFSEENDLPLEVKFQAYHINGDLKSTSEKSVARNLNQTERQKPTWNFIKEQMQNGENVILNYNWKVGSNWYGHSVCLTSLEEFASGKKKIKFKHDVKQETSGGTREDSYEVTVDSDGWVRFGPDNINMVTCVVAESPIPFGRETAAWLNELFLSSDQSNNSNSGVTSSNSEFFEICLNNSSIDLSKFKVTLYDGNDGRQYSTFGFDQLSKTDYGNVTVYFYRFLNNDLKSPPAGIAVSYSGTVIPGQFISYGGAFTAKDGDAQGLLSTNIGDVFPGVVFALSGSGLDYQSFGWTYTLQSSPGFLNNDQTFTEQGPGKPTPLGPINESKDPASPVSFNWSAGQNAASYDLQYSQDSNFINDIFSSNNITNLSVSIADLGFGLRYNWRIRSKNNFGVSAFSDINSFTTKLRAPTNLSAQLNAQDKVVLSWVDNSTNENEFAIEKRIAQNSFSELTRVSQNVLTYNDNDVSLGNNYSYRVKALNADAESDYSNIASIIVTGIQVDDNIPDDFKLYQNYPNPFNPSTTIRFDVPKFCRVKIVLFDVLGREMIRIADGDFSAGTHVLSLDLENFASGIYYCIMETENFRDSKKIILLK